MGSRTVDCRKFSPNIFNKSKCSHCFRQREEHSAAALECNRASRKVSKCGYLFVAPDWDFSNPLYRTKRWQRRWFVLYDDGELTYSVDEHPETIPQACIDMTKVLEVSSAEDVTGHTNSLAITAPDRVTFVKGTCPEEAKWWLNILGAFPKTKGRHKRNATFPGGQATTILSTQVQTKTSRNRHNSYHPEIIQSPVTPIAVVNIDSWKIPPSDENDKNVSNENSTSNSGNMNSSNISRVYIDQPISSKSPPTRDKLYPEGKAQTRIRNRNRNSNNNNNNSSNNNNNNNNNSVNVQQQPQQPPPSQDSTDTGPCLLIEKVHCEDKLKDIGNTITNYNQNRWNTTSSPIIVTTAPVITDIIIADEKPTRDVISKPQQQQNRPQSLAINTQQSTAKSSAPSIVSAIVKKKSGTLIEITSQNNSSVNNNSNSSSNNNNNINNNSKQQHNERGDPDGGCNIDDMPVNYLLNKNQELRVNIPSDEVILNSKKGWLMKQDSRGGEWTRHWFTLHGAALFYYRDPVAEERGVLDGVLDVNSLTGIQEMQLPQNYGFQLMTWDNRRILLATISSNIRNNWINVLKTAAGLTTNKEMNTNSTDKNSSDIKNTTDDLKICEIEKNNSNSTVVVNSSNNNNNNNNITVKSPITPLTPKSILFSSDEEYRTASEGGRRDSVDWGSPISTSPPIPLTTITTTRTKDRLRSRSNSNSRLYSHNGTQNNKRSRSSPPTSRRSTIDSVGSDDMIIIHPVEEEIDQIIDPEIELRLVSAEKELSLLKDEAQEQENRVTTLLTTLEKTETDLTKRIKEAEKARDNLGKQLTENKNQAQDYIERLTLELEENHKIIRDLEDKLARGIEENEILYKKLNNVEINNHPSSTSSSISSLNRIKLNKRMSSLSDLTSLSAFDPFTLDRDYLAEEYNELKHRFEKAVHEIKLMKKELKEAQNQYDSLEIIHAALKQDLECRKVEDESQNNMMAARIQDLTSKYYSAERQVRNLKSKLAKSTEKRRSLSLKGRESLSLPKEFEEKVIELENKIDAIEGNSTKSEDRATLKKSSRLRRKSLDNSSINSEPIQVLLRLNTLEKRVDNHSNESINSNINNSNSNIHQNAQNTSSQSPKMTDHLIDRLKSLEGIVIATRDRIEQSLSQLQNLKSHSSHRTRRSVSPITDKKDTLKFIEKCLSEAGKMLKDSCENCVISSGQDNIILLPETSPIKLALVQLESQLRTKLNDLLKQRRVLRERNELHQSKDLELLAERVAFESVVFGKLRESIARGDNNSNSEYGEKETRSEICETSQLLALLKLKLGGKCTIKPNGSIDILASVLARRLVLSASRIGKLKIPEITPVNSAILDELLRQQNELNVIVMRYKNNAIETLASGLAAETLNYISSNDAIHGAVQEAWRQAQETVNSELIQSEISNIMLRQAERYENLITPSFGYTLTHNERITFENFADSVQDSLRKEMDLVITQLNKMYEEYLDKMKRGQWNIHLSHDHNISEGRQLLCEFADIVAHKALIDARINILKGEYTPPHLLPVTIESPASSSSSPSPSSLSKDKLPSKDLIVNLNKLQKYENLFSELAENLEISNPADILAEADFNFLYKYFCYDNLINKIDLNEISNSVIKLENSIIKLEKLINNNNNNNSEINNNNISNDNEILSFKNIYVKNNKLIDRVNSITEEIKKLNSTNKLCPNCIKFEKSLVDSKSLYENKILELKSNFEANQAQLKLNLNENNQKLKLLNDEKLLIINELSKKTQLIVKFEAEIKNLNSKINLYQIDINNKLTEITKLGTCKDECNKLKVENKTLQDNLDKEKERIKKLEKHLEYLENEHQIHIEQIQENFNGKFIINNNDSNNNLENSDVDDDDNDLVCDNNMRNEESLRKRYQKEIEQLRALCEKGLAAMESSHRRIIAELEEKHRNAIQELLSDKEQALAEETQATLAALDAMRKAHQNEVQREVTRFKQEFIKQFQLGGNTLTDPKEKEHELEDVRLEILSLSEKYSSKCVEAASLEDKLKMATQQIKQSQHIIQQLEMRNKQLRAHLMSDDIDVSSVNSATQSKDKTPNPVNMHDERNLRKNNSVVLQKNHTEDRKKHEIHPKMNSVEEINLSSVYTPVYNPTSLLTSLGSCESLNTLPQTTISEGFMPPVSAAAITTTKIISPKSLTMKLRLNRNNINYNNNNNNTTLLSNINHNNYNNNNLENSYEGEYLKTNPSKLLCSPPPLNGKDVEHLRKFELEI